MCCTISYGEKIVLNSFIIVHKLHRRVALSTGQPLDNSVSLGSTQWT